MKKQPYAIYMTVNEIKTAIATLEARLRKEDVTYLEECFILQNLREELEVALKSYPTGNMTLLGFPKG